MSEPVHTSETPATGTSESPFQPATKVFVGDAEVTVPPAQEASAQSWDELFKGEDPAKVRQALADSRRWEQRAKENKSAADRLKEIEDRDLSELQRVQRDRDDLAAKYAELEQERLRTRVAIAKGHPELADKLTGSSEEELAAHADWFITWRGQAPPTTPRPDPGQGPRPSTPEMAADQEYNLFFPNG